MGIVNGGKAEFNLDLSYYQHKFKEFLRLIEDVKNSDEIDVVLVHHPQVLGDNYEEIVESLNQLADAEVPLRIVPRDRREGGGSQ